LVKFVNSLCAATEIGGPSASAHLLGLPDHYTDRVFKQFYWKGYVRRALESCPRERQPFINVDGNVSQEADGVVNDRVVVAADCRRVVPLSKVNDYVWRPRECENMCLYEFLCCTDVCRRPPSKRSSPSVPSADFEDVDSDSSNELPESSSPPKDGMLAFVGEHPMRTTHYVKKRTDNARWTLNFSGGVLPRPDRGDREEYCCVMLVLFSPSGWRTGQDLLHDDESWTSAFDRTVFDARHMTVMRNMNVLYECHDARDDFSA
ncbi:hypothetical protein FKP32DRAFT_1549529, partial [Trametes sanguinea]